MYLSPPQGRSAPCNETCSMQVAVCIESICTIPDPLCTHSALLGGILHSAPALCIPCDSFFGLSYLYWASFCILHLHLASYSVRSLLAVGEFCILHPASCILHVSHRCSFGPASAFCILHLHPASGAKSTTHTSPFRTSGFNLRSFFAWTSLRL